MTGSRRAPDPGAPFPPVPPADGPAAEPAAPDGEVPPPPDAARAIFGSALPVVEAYARLLAGPGVERGLIGPAEAPRLWDRHLLNSAAVAELVPDSCVLADIGTGAGLPGLVLAILRPRARVILVEPMARRTVFLLEAAGQLGLENIEVRRGRAEDFTGQIRADVVTARAVAGLDKLAVLASGVARPGGLVLAIKGRSAAGELDRARPVLRKLGATEVQLVQAGLGLLSEPATVIRFRTALH